MCSESFRRNNPKETVTVNVALTSTVKHTEAKVNDSEDTLHQTMRSLQERRSYQQICA